MSRQPYLHNLESLKLAMEISQTIRQSQALVAESQRIRAIAQEVPTITIRRDLTQHAWVHGEGTEKVATPFSDNAPADSVVRWLRTNAGGRLNVKVDLGQ